MPRKKTAKATNTLCTKGATPMSISIDLHYRRLGIRQRWDWERWKRLCQFLQVTSEELASLIMLDPRSLRISELNNKFSGTVCLMLTILEARVMKNYPCADIIENPFYSATP